MQEFRGHHTKAFRTSGSFGAALTDQVAGSRTNSSARNVVHLCPERTALPGILDMKYGREGEDVEKRL